MKSPSKSHLEESWDSGPCSRPGSNTATPVKLISIPPSASDPPSPLASLATHLISLHRRPHNRPIIVTNIWDAATAERAAGHSGSTALATASYAIAASCGVSDEDLTLEQNLAALDRGIVAAAKAVGKPLTVDLQSGYGDRLSEAVRELVRRGVVGINLEDRDSVTGQLYSVEEAVRRVKEALAVAGGSVHKASDGLGGIGDATDAGTIVKGFVINARTDVLLTDGGTIEQAIERGRRYLDAGATTVFIWGGPKRGGLKRAELARAVAELRGRVSVKLSFEKDALTVTELVDIGVARISCGPELWRKAMKAFDQGVDDILSLR